jgi:hypothetical protein
MMKTCVRTLTLLLVVLMPIVLLGARASGAGDDDHRRHGGAVKLLTTVPIPPTHENVTNGLYSFDISFVDQSTQTYYLADRSNAVVDVVDAKTGTLVKQIAADFTGVAVVNGAVQGGQSGPNGVVAAFPWLFVTDAPSRVVSIDLETDTLVSSVSTGGADHLRADELAYDPQDGLLLVINANDMPPFGTLIAVDQATGQLTVGTQIPLPFATNGAEQPVWDPGTRKFYLSIPEINGHQTNEHGAVIRLSTTGEVEAQYPIDGCGPAGLTRGPHHELLVGCNTLFDTAGHAWNPAGTVTAAPKDVIVDVHTGRTTDVPGVGPGDEVWYNAGDGHYYATGSGSPLRPTPAAAAQGASVLGVIGAEDQTLRQLVPTLNVPAVGTGNSSTEHPAGTAHSVAASVENNHVLVALAANNVFPDCLTGCIAVYGMSDADTD